MSRSHVERCGMTSKRLESQGTNSSKKINDMKQIEWKHLYDTNFEHVRRCVLHPHTESRVLLRSKPLIVLQLRSKLLEVYVVKPAGTWPNPDRHGAEYTPAWPVSWRRFRTRYWATWGSSQSVSSPLERRRLITDSQNEENSKELGNQADSMTKLSSTGNSSMLRRRTSPVSLLRRLTSCFTFCLVWWRQRWTCTCCNPGSDSMTAWMPSIHEQSANPWLSRIPLRWAAAANALNKVIWDSLPSLRDKRKCVGSIRTPGFWLPPDLRPAGPIPPNTKDCWFVSNVKSVTKTERCWFCWRKESASLKWKRMLMRSALQMLESMMQTFSGGFAIQACTLATQSAVSFARTSALHGRAFFKRHISGRCSIGIPLSSIFSNATPPVWVCAYCLANLLRMCTTSFWPCDPHSETAIWESRGPSANNHALVQPSLHSSGQSNVHA